MVFTSQAARTSARRSSKSSFEDDPSLIKFSSNKVVHYTKLLRDYLKNESDNSMTIYFDKGKIVANILTQSSELVPKDKGNLESNESEFADEDLEMQEEPLPAANKKKIDLDLQELRDAIDNC